MKKTSAIHTSDEGLAFRMCEEIQPNKYTQLNHKKAKNFKISKRSEQKLHEREDENEK